MLRSKYQTKEWRKCQEWYISGKMSECEKYQIKLVEQITQNHVGKTDFRLNYETSKLQRKPRLSGKDAFKWTENFDGIQFHNGYFMLFNFKMVCDKGGSQTRTLREVYHFIKAQESFVDKHGSNNLIFVNILDGDECYRSMDRITSEVSSSRIFIGDSFQFREWFSAWKADN